MVHNVSGISKAESCELPEIKLCEQENSSEESGTSFQAQSEPPSRSNEKTNDDDTIGKTEPLNEVTRFPCKYS